MCGVYKTLRKALGYPVFEFSTRMSNMMVMEGKRIIRAERKHLQEEFILGHVDLAESLVAGIYKSPAKQSTMRLSEIDHSYIPTIRGTLLNKNPELAASLDSPNFDSTNSFD